MSHPVSPNHRISLSSHLSVSVPAPLSPKENDLPISSLFSSLSLQAPSVEIDSKNEESNSPIQKASKEEALILKRQFEEVTVDFADLLVDLKAMTQQLYDESCALEKILLTLSQIQTIPSLTQFRKQVAKLEERVEACTALYMFQMGLLNTVKNIQKIFAQDCYCCVLKKMGSELKQFKNVKDITFFDPAEPKIIKGSLFEDSTEQKATIAKQIQETLASANGEFPNIKYPQIDLMVEMVEKNFIDISQKYSEINEIYENI